MTSTNSCFVASVLRWNTALLALALMVAACGGGGTAQPMVDGSCSGAACEDMGGGGCKADTDCTAAGKARCDQASGTCVACVGDGDCELGQRCNAATHACATGCTATHGCPGAEVCEVDAGMCVGCVNDGDCKDASKPHCDAATHLCGCDPAHDACGHGQYCAPQANGAPACVTGCKTDTDCLVTGDTDAGSTSDAGAADGGAPVSATPRCSPQKHQCVGCLVDGDCPLGKTCQNNACADGCSSGHGCASTDETCCNKTCVDLKNDTKHCGACGTTCGTGETCCSGTCANTESSATNCGTCGYACSLSNAFPGCASGLCGVSSCKDGFENCDGDSSNGCEINTDSDINNCGGCGIVCSLQHANSICSAGVCKIASCAAGWADCNNEASDGCEQNIDNGSQPGGGLDGRSNCGGCGITCSDKNIQTPKCEGGQCKGICAAPYIDCNGLQVDGCECNATTSYCDGSECKAKTGGSCGNDTQCGGTDNCCNNYCVGNKQTNVNNCGACGTVCSPNNIARSCSAGVCNGTCDAGYADCNNNKQTDGCEKYIAGDAANCGSCGKVCSSNHVTPQCTSGACNGACLSENIGRLTYYYADCNRNKQTDGCETNISTDRNNCGGCGLVCTGANTTTFSCILGGCSNTCQTNFADCNGNGYDGCEVDLLSNSQNCGTCGHACPVLQYCSAGVCKSLIVTCPPFCLN